MTVPDTILTKNIFQIKKYSTLQQALLFLSLWDVGPSNVENNIIIGGTVYRNICRMTLGRYPVTSWTMYGLHMKDESKGSTFKWTKGHMSILNGASRISENKIQQTRMCWSVEISTILHVISSSKSKCDLVHIRFYKSTDMKMNFNTRVQFQYNVGTYFVNNPLRKGSFCCNCSSSDRPRINVTGNRNKSRKTIEPRSVAIRRIQSCL
jgi:hypothetical protein